MKMEIISKIKRQIAEKYLSARCDMMAAMMMT